MCPQCGAVNRVQSERMREENVSGRRKAPLWPDAPLELTAATFDRHIAHSGVPILVDFWAPWCGPCRMVSPIVDEIAEESSAVKVAKINIDEQPQLASQYGVMSIPTLMLFENGDVVDKAVGARNKSFILQMLEG